MASLSSNWYVQHILKCLQEYNLPIPPTNIAVPQKPDFIPDKCDCLIYEFPKDIISNKKLLDIVIFDGQRTEDCIGIEYVRDIVNTPQEGRFIWVNSGCNRIGISPEDAEKKFAKDEIGATVRIGLYLLLYCPWVFRGPDFILIGSQSQHSRYSVPFLWKYNYRARLDILNVDSIPLFPAGVVSFGDIA